jgi:zinc protease
LASLPVLERTETWKDHDIDFPDQKVTRTVTKGLEPKSYVALLFGTDDFLWTRDREYLLDSLSEVLDIRLRKKISEEAGGTYNVQVRYSFQKFPDNEYRIDIIFGCDPRRVDELTSLVFEEISALQEAPPEEETIAKVKEIQKRTYEVSLEKNEFWLSRLYHHFLYGSDPRMVLEYDSLVDSLSEEDISQIANEVLSKETYVQVILEPEKTE